MSLRVDTSSLISGALVVGDRGLGVLGSEVPSSGEAGAGYLYNDLSLPADASKEVCGRITTWPTNGDLFAYEDSSFTYDGTTDSFFYQLYVDGVATGSPVEVFLNVGGASFGFTVTTASATFAGSANSSTSFAFAATTGQSVFAGSASAVGGFGFSAVTSDVLFVGSVTGTAFDITHLISAAARTTTKAAASRTHIIEATL